MGKIYIDTVKYVIHANVEIIGLVEKPDVVGAIFGQTEGLLGEELDLRELQKNGRIGRIEVNLQPKGNKSIGSIEVPSSLDVVETCIIGSALETVDRVGPCEATITVQRVEDTRSIKRKKVVDRAKELVKTMLTTEIPERKELSEIVRAEVKTSEITTYGPEKLPAGPNLDAAEAVIMVEGRADVINLLKNDINNVIAIGGANVPKSVVDLCRRKESTLFVDGDRGGDIILREVTNIAEIDYIARAPLGLEVEELARKEILKALRSRVPIEQSESVRKRREEFHSSQTFDQPSRTPPQRGGGGSQSIVRDIEQMIDVGGEKKEQFPRETREPREQREQRAPRESFRPSAPVAFAAPAAPQNSGLAAMPAGVQTELSALEGSLKARFYDVEMKMLKEVAVRDVTRSLEETQNVNTVVLDGIITQRLVDLTESKAVKMLVGIKMGNVFRKPEKLQIFVKQ